MSGESYANYDGIYTVKGQERPVNKNPARYELALWIDSNDFVYYGFGHTKDNMFDNSVWRFNPHTKFWTWLKGSNVLDDIGNYTQSANGDHPEVFARSLFQYWIDKEDDFYIFGGWRGIACADFCRLSNDTLMWTFLAGTTSMNLPLFQGVYGTKGIGDNTTVPKARYGAFFWQRNGTFWMYGGQCGLGVPRK